MIRHTVLHRVLVMIVLMAAVSFPLWAEQKDDSWKKWLAEVDIIMSGTERGVAKLLVTIEERQRFQELFWKSRDATPKTPDNEFQQEFYRRIAYARQNLHGPNSDRGRIYILLGKPSNLSTFSGSQNLVECQLWNYENMEKPGILPFMNLVFFRPHDSGDFQLYTPGIHSPTDLLAPQMSNRFRTTFLAYKEIKKDSSELASASLSIVPGEGDPRGGSLITSSNYALNGIYSLPEREAELSYIRHFQNPTGVVEVSHTTREILGHGYITVLPNQNIHFVHYALAPETLNLKQVTPDQFQAEIHLFISIETLSGAIVYQDRHVIPFHADMAKKKRILGRKVVFRDFAPILDGQYNILLTFLNASTQEFFTYKSTVSVAANPEGLATVMGYQFKELHPVSYLPFATDDYLVLVDPSGNFSQKDTLEGVVHSAEPPQVVLEKTGPNPLHLPVETTAWGDHRYLFRQSLKDVPDGSYLVQVKAPGAETQGYKIHVLPFYIEMTRPFVMERPEPKTAWNNYLFVLVQQYLAVGHTARALEYCNQIPQTLWNASSLPIIAKAYYVAENYTRVKELLERQEVKKEYPVLLMLANSCIALKQYPEALTYLQKIRQYGDTVEINHLLAATYLNLGDRTHAKTYYERAKKIQNTPAKETENKNNEINKEGEKR